MNARKRILWFSALLLAAVGVIGGLMTGLGEHSIALAATFGKPPTPWQKGFEPAVKKILPAVVSISSIKVVQPPMFADPEFRQFFESHFGKAPHQMRQNSLGSGVIATRDGHILTNCHVVDSADSVEVSLSNGHEYEAKVIGCDQPSDLAVLKIKAINLPVADFGGPDPVAVGDLTLAVGNPFGVGQTVTMGIVSGTGRGGMGIEDLEDFIQTDAAINPGNSGGPLVNTDGNLIGITTAILTGAKGGNQGIGFAIPITMARTVMNQIITNGKVVRGWIGASAQAVTPEIAKSFGLGGEPHGALIGDVAPGGPSAKSGLRTGDIILASNGADVPDSRQLGLKISEMSPGTKVNLKVLRDGKQIAIAVVLSQMPTSKPEPHVTPKPELGASLEPLTPEINEHLNLPDSTTGLIVTDLDPGGTAAQAGIEHGDIIQELNHKPVNDVEAFQAAIASAGQEPQLLLVDRAGKHLFITAKLQ
jgi:serine protease Do